MRGLRYDSHHRSIRVRAAFWQILPITHACPRITIGTSTSANEHVSALWQRLVEPLHNRMPERFQDKQPFGLDRCAAASRSLVRFTCDTGHSSTIRTDTRTVQLSGYLSQALSCSPYAASKSLRSSPFAKAAAQPRRLPPHSNSIFAAQRRNHRDAETPGFCCRSHCSGHIASAGGAYLAASQLMSRNKLLNFAL